VKKCVFVRSRRFSAEGLLKIDGMIPNTVVEGSMTRIRFLQYFELAVVSFLPFFSILQYFMSSRHFVLCFLDIVVSLSWTILVLTMGMKLWSLQRDVISFFSSV
jgi:hypothetical protein